MGTMHPKAGGWKKTMNNLPKRGFVYIGVNEGMLDETRKSAESLKEHHRDAHVTFFTDNPVEASKLSCFDNVIRIPSRTSIPVLKDKKHYPDQGIIAKTYYMSKSPYRYTLFLDGDVLFCDNVLDLFELLEDGNFDMAFANDEAHVSGKKYYDDVPECFTKPNLGVVLFRRNITTNKFFKIWWNTFHELVLSGIGNPDEATFVKAMWDCKSLKYATLPSEYNCRFIFPYIVRGKVKIFHGRNDKLDKIAIHVNKFTNTYRVGFDEKIIAVHKPITGFKIINK